jgi:hypothetical protein
VASVRTHERERGAFTCWGDGYPGMLKPWNHCHHGMRPWVKEKPGRRNRAENHKAKTPGVM